MTEQEISTSTATPTGLDPVFDQLLAAAKSRRILDLGCGDGHDARQLARQGYEVTAIDASEVVLESARAATTDENVEFLLGDMGAVERLVRGHFGAAVCLGNSLPYLLSPESLSRMLFGLRRRLLPGAPFLLEVLNYDRFVTGKLQALPVEIIPAETGDLVVVGLVEPREDGIVTHTTSTLRHQPRGEVMMDVVATQANQLRGWKRSELETMLDVARFSPKAVFGDRSGSSYDPSVSPELVMIAG